jgi:hypothetical protein
LILPSLLQIALYNLQVIKLRTFHSFYDMHQATVFCTLNCASPTLQINSALMHGKNTSSISMLIVFPISHKYTEPITQLHKRLCPSPHFRTYIHIYITLPTQIESNKRKKPYQTNKKEHRISKRKKSFNRVWLRHVERLQYLAIHAPIMVRTCNHALMEAQDVVGKRIEGVVLGVLQRGQVRHDRVPR